MRFTKSCARPRFCAGAFSWATSPSFFICFTFVQRRMRNARHWPSKRSEKKQWSIAELRRAFHALQPSLFHPILNFFLNRKYFPRIESKAPVQFVSLLFEWDVIVASAG